MVWARDPEFIDDTGSPMKLRVGGGPSSFQSLMKKARVAIEADRALEQLQALGSVQRCDRGRRVRLVSNVLLTVAGNQFVAVSLLDAIRRFAKTIEHNLDVKPGSIQGRMNRLAYCASLDPAQFVEVQRFVRLSGQAFLDAVDEKLSSCRLENNKKHGLYYGVGIYVTVEKPQKPRRARRAKLQRD